MKLIANILFERLHRYVYDKHLQSNNRDYGLPTKHYSANRSNKLLKYNEKIYSLYNALCPYFEGWRESLKINLPFIKRYERYEPKKLDLLTYEFNKLGIWNKFIYSVRLSFIEVKTLFN